MIFNRFYCIPILFFLFDRSRCPRQKQRKGERKKKRKKWLIKREKKRKKKRIKNSAYGSIRTWSSEVSTSSFQCILRGEWWLGHEIGYEVTVVTIHGSLWLSHHSSSNSSHFRLKFHPHPLFLCLSSRSLPVPTSPGTSPHPCTSSLWVLIRSCASSKECGNWMGVLFFLCQYSSEIYIPSTTLIRSHSFKTRSSRREKFSLTDLSRLLLVLFLERWRRNVFIQRRLNDFRFHRIISRFINTVTLEHHRWTELKPRGLYLQLLMGWCVP